MKNQIVVDIVSTEQKEFQCVKNGKISRTLEIGQ
nr:MAG TPA: hypothetical protein [Caudoviricetes sp.]